MNTFPTQDEPKRERRSDAWVENITFHSDLTVANVETLASWCIEEHRLAQQDLRNAEAAESGFQIDQAVRRIIEMEAVYETLQSRTAQVLAVDIALERDDDIAEFLGGYVS